MHDVLMSALTALMTVAATAAVVKVILMCNPEPEPEPEADPFVGFEAFYEWLPAEQPYELGAIARKIAEETQG